MKLMDINYLFGYIFTLEAVTSSSMLRLKPAGLQPTSIYRPLKADSPSAPIRSPFSVSTVRSCITSTPPPPDFPEREKKMGVFSKRDSHYAFKELDTSAIIQRERRLRLDCGEGEQETFKLFQWDTRWSAFTFDAPRLRLSQQFFPSLSKKKRKKKRSLPPFPTPPSHP